MSISTVTLLGADSKIGPSVYEALVSNGFDVTVLKRKSSKSASKYPKQKFVDDAFAVDELADVLKGQDAMVVAVEGSQSDLQKRIAQAAVRAGVKRFIPADFGSVDSSSELTQELVPLYKHKSAFRQYLIELAEKHPSFSWTSLVCGHFFEWTAFMHVSLEDRQVDIVDNGEAKWSASTFGQIGKATARILQRPEVTKNRMIYIQSFLISQNDMVAAFERATQSKWTVVRHDSRHYQLEQKRKADAGDLKAVENLVWLLGAIDANWEEKKDFAMKDLGLENEDLDTVVEMIVAKHGKA